ncbi:MAG TPA: response regulator [Abditibacteriaceae bacterium]|nr:response regulator [Abditibacteriaceae bacterium]
MQTSAEVEHEVDQESTATAPSAGRILVVDDLPANVRLLAGILKVAGYEVVTATSGPEALGQVESAAPDVVLLDVMMPDMDGFEVCRRIKAQPATALLPVVMVTALQEIADRVTAIEAGADDFLTKPVDDVEVVARVRSLVRIKRQRDSLENAYQDLRRAESMRDSLTAMLVHDLRTPLTAILASLEMLRGGQVGTLDELQREIVEIGTRSSHRLLALVNDLLDVNKMESGKMTLKPTPVAPADLIDAALEQTAFLTGDSSVAITRTLPPDLPMLQADEDLLRRVLINLLGNAIKFTRGPGAIVITISVVAPGDEAHQLAHGVCGGEALLLSVRDNGIGIPVEDQTRIFEKFGQVESREAGRKMSTGLGLTFCKLAVEAHGGRIWVESVPGQGSTFLFTVPLNGSTPATNDSGQ